MYKISSMKRLHAVSSWFIVTSLHSNLYIKKFSVFFSLFFLFFFDFPESSPRHLSCGAQDYGIDPS